MTWQGQVVGAEERLVARRALDAFLGSPATPGGPPRRIASGAPADLLLLHVPLAEALARLTADHVAVTLVNGRVVHSRVRHGRSRKR